jgi:hypothetical protein
VGLEPENHHQQDRTERGNENGPEQAHTKGITQSLHNPTAEQRAQHTGNDVPENSVAAALHDQARDKANHQANHDEQNESP